MDFPLWATPERQDRLAELALSVTDYDIDLFTGELLSPTISYIIEEWKRDDRVERAIQWRRERRQLHSAPHRHFPQVRTREWDSIVQDNYLAQRPIFRLVAIGVDAFSFRRVAEVEVPGLRLTIWVNLTGVKLSKNKLRKVTRYAKGDGAPTEIHDRIAERVRSYLK